MSDDARFVYAPLGGAGEIGMNMYLYGVGPADDRRWLMVDCGVAFGDMDSAPGIDLVTADTAFIAAEADRLEAIVITHAHEDHVGAVGLLYPRLRAPIIATPFAAEVAKRKLAERGFDAKVVKTRRPGERSKFGPFDVEFFPVTHSIPDANAVVIRTSEGAVFHSGDFKIDPTPAVGHPMDMAALGRIGDEGVLALACDSTNVFQDGWSGSEADVKQSLASIIAGCEGAVCATTFASNVGRLMTLVEAAQANERSIVVAGRAMRRMIETALDTGAIQEFPTTISEERTGELPSRHLFYLVTGSQGENRAALARIANDSHPSVRLKSGDAVIFSSKTIPGNERGVYKLYNRLSEMGVRVIDEEDGRIHVSGHARREEIAALYAALRPQIAIPLHGEHRHLVEHAASAKGWGAKASVVAPNGALVALDPEAPRVITEVESGRLYLDGETMIGAMDGVVRSRLKLARLGHIVVAVTVDEAGDLIADCEVRVVGGPEDDPSWPDPLETMIAEAVDNAVERAPKVKRRSDESLEELASIAARRVASKYWGKKPVTTVLVTRLEEE